MILKADGEPFSPPQILTAEELHIITRALGMNKRGGTPVRNRYSIGKAPKPTDPRVQALEAMRKKGLVALYFDAARAKAEKRFDSTRDAEVVAVVTPFGAECLKATILEHSFGARK